VALQDTEYDWLQLSNAVPNKGRYVSSTSYGKAVSQHCKPLSIRWRKKRHTLRTPVRSFINDLYAAALLSVVSGTQPHSLPHSPSIEYLTTGVITAHRSSCVLERKGLELQINATNGEPHGDPVLVQ